MQDTVATLNAHTDRLAQKLSRAMGTPILTALDDPAIVEILLNPDGQLWTDTHQGMRRIGDMPPTRAENLIGTVASFLNTVANADHPILEGELPDGCRFEGILPPVSSAPVFSIRKRAAQIFTIDDYQAQGVITAAQAGVIRQAVAGRQNIVIAGGCSSGKTTLANAVLAECVSQGNPAERYIILEDTVELQCAAENAVALRTSETADLTRLLRATLRLRPDRIIVGEVRDGSALTLLKAWGTGHPGGICTVHANSAQAALIRLEQLIQEAGVPPQPALIAEAVDLIVFIGLTPEGRRVRQIVNVDDYQPQHGYLFTIKGDLYA
jgi:P-type conjugative transfer ATPase TrbB